MYLKKLPIALCLGLPGSASTWVYNICLQLLARKAQTFQCAYSDSFEGVAGALFAAKESSAAFTIKSHLADEAMMHFFSQPNVSGVLTIRDPRDCVLSLMERFHFSFGDALSQLAASCESVLHFRKSNILLFRYEDRFFESRQTLVDLHRYLQIDTEEDFAELQRNSSKNAIMSFIDSFDELPKERIVSGPIDSYDLATHWHTRHFGDGLVGKWQRRFNDEQKAELHEILGPAIAALGYADTMVMCEAA